MKFHLLRLAGFKYNIRKLGKVTPRTAVKSEGDISRFTRKYWIVTAIFGGGAPAANLHVYNHQGIGSGNIFDIHIKIRSLAHGDSAHFVIGINKFGQ